MRLLLILWAVAQVGALYFPTAVVEKLANVTFEKQYLAILSATLRSTAHSFTKADGSSFSHISAKGSLSCLVFRDRIVTGKRITDVQSNRTLVFMNDLVAEGQSLFCSLQTTRERVAYFVVPFHNRKAEYLPLGVAVRVVAAFSRTSPFSQCTWLSFDSETNGEKNSCRSSSVVNDDSLELICVCQANNFILKFSRQHESGTPNVDPFDVVTHEEFLTIIEGSLYHYFGAFVVVCLIVLYVTLFVLALYEECLARRLKGSSLSNLEKGRFKVYSTVKSAAPVSKFRMLRELCLPKEVNGQLLKHAMQYHHSFIRVLYPTTSHFTYLQKMGYLFCSIEMMLLLNSIFVTVWVHIGGTDLPNGTSWKFDLLAGVGSSILALPLAYVLSSFHRFTPRVARKVRRVPKYDSPVSSEEEASKCSEGVIPRTATYKAKVKSIGMEYDSEDSSSESVKRERKQKPGDSPQGAVTWKDAITEVVRGNFFAAAAMFEQTSQADPSNKGQDGKGWASHYAELLLRLPLNQFEEQYEAQRQRSLCSVLHRADIYCRPPLPRKATKKNVDGEAYFSLQRAFTTALPGNRIYLSPGRYPAFTAKNLNDISILPSPGCEGKVFIKGHKNRKTPAISLVQCRGVIVEGLNVMESQVAINATASEGCTFKGNIFEIRQTPSKALLLHKDVCPAEFAENNVVYRRLLAEYHLPPIFSIIGHVLQLAFVVFATIVLSMLTQSFSDDQLGAWTGASVLSIVSAVGILQPLKVILLVKHKFLMTYFSVD